MYLPFRTEEDLAIGRRLCEAGEQPLSMVACLQMCAWEMLGRAKLARELIEAERPRCLRIWKSFYKGTRMTTALIKADTKSKLTLIDQTIRDAQTEIATARADGNELVSLATMAAAMESLRKQFDTAVLSLVKPLMNTKLGFQTDRDPSKGYQGGPYPDDTIRDALLAGALQGARFTGNEINIIAGGLYLTREFYERMFCNVAGVSHVEPPAIGIPRETVLGDKKYATINARLKFRLHGKQEDLDFSNERAVVVTWNKGMGVDAVHGKARKRIYAYAYRYVTGQTFHESADDSANIIEGEVVPPPAPSAAADPTAPGAGMVIDLVADALRELLACKTPEAVDLCALRWWENHGVDIRQQAADKKLAQHTNASSRAKR
jgi:hypothetical protein